LITSLFDGNFCRVAEKRVIPISRPFLGPAEVEAVGRVLLSGWVTQGPEVAAFEGEFAAFVGAPYACAVSSGTAALSLALRSVGVRPGDEVITASHSFIATANSVRHCGAVPVFVDIDRPTYNMDATLVERVVSSRTRAILCVHQLGMPCDLDAVLSIARRHGLPVVEDAACALGSEVLVADAWERIGKPHGDVACFSFHPRKAITTGEGGMLVTSSASRDAEFRLLRHQGTSLPAEIRHGADRIAFESYPIVGYNYRLTDLQAAVGREQLKRLPGILEARRAQARRYQSLLEDVAGLELPEEPRWARSNWQSYCVGLPEGRDQRAVMQAMLDAGVATRRGVMCAHREPAYQSEPWSCGAGPVGCGCAPGECARLERSEAAQDRSITLPLFHQMTEGDQDAVALALRNACSS
jgi:dTDP-4-amino-4,6-dideoxygalactose transaminase